MLTTEKKHQQVPTLKCVIPCFNEEAILRYTIETISDFLVNLIKDGLISEKSGMLFVDDGSIDRTWEIISFESNINKKVEGIKLSKNYGHQNAVMCGMNRASGDIVITLDADLQDDIEVIKLMISEYLSGSEIVYGVRSSREADSFFKKFTAESYYRLMRFMKVDIIFNHADYRLMSRRFIDELSKYNESNLFLRGLVPLVGFKSSIVNYARKERIAGETKYPLKKMINFAWQGITSFSIFPLRLIMWSGVFSFLLSVFLIIWALFMTFFTNKVLSGWTSIFVSINFIGSLVLLSLGIIGEYLGKIYQEVKRRPLYHIESETYS